MNRGILALFVILPALHFPVKELKVGAEREGAMNPTNEAVSPSHESTEVSVPLPPITVMPPMPWYEPGTEVFIPEVPFGAFCKFEKNLRKKTKLPIDFGTD